MSDMSYHARERHLSLNISNDPTTTTPTTTTTEEPLKYYVVAGKKDHHAVIIRALRALAAKSQLNVAFGQLL
jgi:hypothetical protein